MAIEEDTARVASAGPTGEADASPVRRNTVRRLRRFLTATAVGAPCNLLLYALFLEVLDWWQPVASFVAALCVVIPRFVINKYWVFESPAVERLPIELAAHLALTAVGMVLAPVVAWLLAGKGASTLVLLLGNLASFTATWFVRFLVLHLVVFRITADTDPVAGNTQ